MHEALDNRLDACRVIAREGVFLESDKTMAFSIVVLVNDHAQYQQMKRSFLAGGFCEDDCEYLVIDNSGDRQTDAYAGLNWALSAARGRFAVLCHQDVRLLDDGRSILEERLLELEARDPSWAVAGNSGGAGVGRLALRITDPHGADQKVGSFPARVASVDENFVVVKRSSRVGFSRDLRGFHLYGADLCLNADVLGWTSYVIDFHLEHLSPGNKSASFFEAESAFRAKWERALRPRFIQTTCTLLRVGGGRVMGGVSRLLEWGARKSVRVGVVVVRVATSFGATALSWSRSRRAGARRGAA